MNFKTFIFSILKIATTLILLNVTSQERVTYGTHELTIALKFGDSARKYRWLDRY